MKDVDQQIADVIAREGGYSDHPADRGGPTQWGITEQVARAYGYPGHMRELRREWAAEIYKRRYWSDVRLDQIAPIYPRIASELFDTGVNMGPAVAVKMLQRALNLLNRGASDYPDMTVDGLIGPMTIAALKAYRYARGEKGELVLLSTLDGFQVERYAAITEARPANEAFFFGWLANRIGQAL